jgi:hypothetical protein
MSPAGKEKLYVDYQKGMTVKDLSLKFGILQERVKAIIFQKHMYWNEIYPKLGVSHMRQCMRMEYDYSQKYPFQDYGIDLAEMAENDKGVEVKTITRSAYDTNPSKGDSKWINTYLSKVHSRKGDRVPIGLDGTGPNAYMLTDWVIHRGKGAARVSQDFKDMVRHYGRPSEFIIKDKLKRRLDAGGVRFAA